VNRGIIQSRETASTINHQYIQLTAFVLKQHRTIQNLSAILQAADSSLEAAFKVNIFLSDMSLFADMNEAYKQYWGDVKPSRTCVAVKQLPLGTDVEIECQAVVLGNS
jgi:enamine deaminase RidA (YjgF/YER057c/UK114 family)